MQGKSGRKVRLEGGETLQSSLVTMRWFSDWSLADHPSSLSPKHFFFCSLLHHIFFFFPLGSHSPIFDLLRFRIYLWWPTGQVCRRHEHWCIFVLSEPVVLSVDRMCEKCAKKIRVFYRASVVTRCFGQRFLICFTLFSIYFNGSSHCLGNGKTFLLLFR